MSNRSIYMLVAVVIIGSITLESGYGYKGAVGTILIIFALINILIHFYIEKLSKKKRRKKEV